MKNLEKLMSSDTQILQFFLMKSPIVALHRVVWTENWIANCDVNAQFFFFFLRLLFWMLKPHIQTRIGFFS